MVFKASFLCFSEMRSWNLKGVEETQAPREMYAFFTVNAMALECKPTSHFLAAFNFSLSTRSVLFSPAHPPSPLAFLSPLSAPQWPSPTQSLEQCVWETACVTKAIKHTCAHRCRPMHKHPCITCRQKPHLNSNAVELTKIRNKCTNGCIKYF